MNPYWLGSILKCDSYAAMAPVTGMKFIYLKYWIVIKEEQN
jgi:hypothetical protein